MLSLARSVLAAHPPGLIAQAVQRLLALRVLW